ncbi:hypothetical protein WP1_219 [Pseudomonas phage WP1]
MTLPAYNSDIQQALKWLHNQAPWNHRPDPEKGAMA